VMNDFICHNPTFQPKTLKTWYVRITIVFLILTRKNGYAKCGHLCKWIFVINKETTT